MPKKALPQSKPVAHFIGIGGIGISALARWFLAQNWAVTGSDISDSLIIQNLKKSGARVKIGHKSGNLPRKGLSMVIYSPAIRLNNPEIIRAKELGLKPLSYPETLGCLTKVYRTIAIAGSHGKSTTTALAALTLIRGQLDPNVVIGTNLKEFQNKNFRLGRSKWLIIEADEWQASFLNYESDILIITNIDNEHLDFYKNLNDVKNTFLKFIGQTKPNGVLILNRDDRNLFTLKSPIQKIAKSKNLKVIWYRSKNSALKKVLKIPGAHNVANANAVLTLSKFLKIDKAKSLKALRSYTGAWRRMEYRGTASFDILNSKSHIPVYDDYAHHPTEIKATLQAFREKFPKKKIICVYQPHQAKRLKALFSEFVNAFNETDTLILLPTYEVAGRDHLTSSYTSQKLKTAISKRYLKRPVHYLPSPTKIKSFLNDKLNKNSLIIMMGAGNIVDLTSQLISKPLGGKL